MNRAKFSERHVGSDGLRIFGIVLSGFEVGAIRIRPARAGQRRLDRFTSRSHYSNIETGHGNLVAGFRDGVLRLGVKRRINLLQKLVGSSAGLNVRAMIDELANRDMRSELSHPAEVVTVPMRRDQMV